MAKSDGPSPDIGFTLGWDVVVSYSQKDINRVLETTWQKVLLVLCCAQWNTNKIRPPAQR